MVTRIKNARENAHKTDLKRLKIHIKQAGKKVHKIYPCQGI